MAFVPGFSDTGPVESPLTDLSISANPGCEQPGTKQLCTTALQGICSEGSRVCQAQGLWSDCDPYLQPGVLAEDCGNGDDDDCDGDTDAADTDCTPCVEGQRDSCAVPGARGACAEGSHICTASGTWDVCSGPGAQPENCTNGLDDDCDGSTDGSDQDCHECTPGTEEPCTVPGTMGVCAVGRHVCNSSGAWGGCSGPSPQIENCSNGQDDDCDGNGDAVDLDCVSGCSLPWGGTLPHGQSTTAYEHATELSPETCGSHSETRSCLNGVLSGSFISPSCTQTFRDCALPGYGALAHGAMVSTYDATWVPCGQTCSQHTIFCNDGALQGGTSYIASCAAQDCNCFFGKPGGMAELAPGESCSSDLVNITTTSGCSDGGQHYAQYSCTYTCNANGVLTASPGAPCEMGINGACGGSYSSSSPSTCPDW